MVMSALKVAFIAHEPTKEGAGCFLIDVIDFLLSKHVEMLVIVPSSGPLSEALIQRGVECRYVKSPWWWTCDCTEGVPYRATMAAAYHMSAIVKEWGAQLVYTNSIVAPAGAFAAAFAGLPHMWHIHEFAYNPEAIEMSLPKRILATVMKQTTNVIIFNSHAVAREWDGLLEKTRTVVVYNWTHRNVDTQPGGHNVSLEQKIDNLRNRTFFTHIATVSRWKRQLDSLHALKKVVAEGHDVVLVFAGPINDPLYYQELCDYIRAHSLTDNVKFVGYVENPASALNQAVATLVCSLMEPFGRVTIESMAAGVPVIGAASAGTAEIIQDEVNGLLFPPGDSDALARRLLRLLSDSELGKRLSTQGLERVKRFSSPEKEMEPVMRLMRELLTARNPSWPLGCCLFRIAALVQYARARSFRSLFHMFLHVYRLPGSAGFVNVTRDAIRPTEGKSVHGITESEGVSQASTAHNLARAKRALREKTETDLRDFLESGGQLRFTAAECPRITVLIILWNQADLTLACLKALAEEDDGELEILVVDNASTDKTSELLARISGIRVINNEENVGFLRAVNQGASVAAGEYLLLLNNDAVIRPGSMCRASRLMAASHDIGAVGARIILPNGLLQEAGSIVWNDGTCLGYAREQLPEANEVMFRRDVDYCSGVFLLTRRDLFMEMGGFDEVFVPAYYEETDYCFRLWERGMRVVYDPDVVVDHFEFGSSGTSDRAIAQMKKNHQVLLKKHAIPLANRFLRSPANILKARMRDTCKGRVLFLDDRVPLRNLGSGYPRARLIINEMHENGWFVTFYPMYHMYDDWAETYQNIPREIEVIQGFGPERLESFLEERTGYYDVILVSRPINIPCVSEIYKRRPKLFTGAHIIYDAEAVWAARDVERMRLTGNPPDENQIRELIDTEVDLACIADRIVTVSADEASYFSRNGYGDVAILGHAVQASPTPGTFHERKDMLFVGQLTDEESPNVDSIIWFVRHVLPLIRSRIGPDFTLYLVGRNGSPSINALNDENVSIVGPVDDVTPWYDKCRIFVAPTRYAAGIPHKVHEAAGYGIPVVATPLLARQLGWENEEQLLVGNDAKTFAEQCVRLYTNETVWCHLRESALHKLGSENSPEAFRHALDTLLSFDGEKKNRHVTAVLQRVRRCSIRSGRKLAKIFGRVC